MTDATRCLRLSGFVAGFLLQALRATRLIGSTVVLTGVRPALASILVQLGTPLAEARAFVTLADGLREALAVRGG